MRFILLFTVLTLINILLSPPLLAESEQGTEKAEEKVIYKDGTPIILVGMDKFPDIRLTLDERRRVEQGGVITRIFAVSDPAKAPGHPCAGLNCKANEVCMAYDYQIGGRITFCAEKREGDTPKKE